MISKDAKSNNIQLIRFIAAVMVIISHSFYISGCENRDPVALLSRGSFDFGALAVEVLFLISGFMLAKTLSRAKKTSFLSFLRRRLKRMMPALGFVVAACILAGAFISELSAADYFHSPQTWKYLLNAFFIPVHNLPGVFEENIYGQVVNGALWTMPLELLCCIAGYLFFALGLSEKKRALITLPFAAAAILSAELFLPELIRTSAEVAVMFYMGMLYYILWDSIKFSLPLAAAALAGFLLLCALRLPIVGAFLLEPYFVLYLSFCACQCSSRIASSGNVSYCLYLWGFPVQQLIVRSFGGGPMSPALNFALSLPAALVPAILTHIFIERRAMSLK